MDQESENRVRLISFFLMIQKFVKNRAKTSLKKLTFTALRPTHFESFYSYVQSNCIFIYQVVNRQRKNYSFFEKRLSFAHLSTTHGESFTLPILLLISSREAGCEYKLFQVLV